MKYMLDTNIVIYAKNNSPEHVAQTFQKFSPDDLCISSITLAELEYGICNSSQPERNRPWVKFGAVLLPRTSPSWGHRVVREEEGA